MVVVDKPSGLLVHRSAIDRHETQFALQLVRDQLGRHVYPVHRLDKGTSGALVFALDREAARDLSLAFGASVVRKHYVALVRGWPEPSGLIEQPLADVEDERIPRSSASAPRIAATAFRTRARFELPVRVDRYATSRYALLACTRLEFESTPATNGPLVVEAPLAAEFDRLLARLCADRVTPPGPASTGPSS